MKTVFLILLSIYVVGISTAQISYDKRIEFELKDDYVNEQVFEFGEDGLLMVSRSEKATDGTYEWKFEKFNTQLESVSSKSLFIDDHFQADELFHNAERLHIMLRDRRGKFTIISIAIKTMEIHKTDGEIPKKSWIKELAILGDYAYFNSSIKGAPFLFSFNWKTGEQKMINIGLENVNPKKLLVNGFQVSESSNEILLYIKQIISKKESDDYVVKLNDSGKKEGLFNVTKDIDLNVVDLSASKVNSNQYMITGTYSTKYTGISEGLFFGMTEDNEMAFIKLYNFLDLKNFLNYLPENKQKKIEKKRERKAEQGKQYTINYRIAGHEVISLEDGYIFLGEVYYPTYRTESYTSTTIVNGVATTTTHYRQVFDGYQYTHAVIAKFDRSGTLLWDQTFEMWPAYKPFYVKRFISVKEDEMDAVSMVYSSRNRIYSKSYDFAGRILKDFESNEIETGHTTDKSIRSYSNINYWYDRYFVVFGTQKIKNSDEEPGKKKRTVYFINTIKFEQ
jgi:hypothetical protein